jgi:hypothetical protein
MSLLYKGDFQTNMRVVLVQPDTDYTINENNPLYGTQLQCEGVITDILYSGSGVRVAWDNGRRNCYKEGELAAVNTLFKDIWGEVG